MARTLRSTLLPMCGRFTNTGSRDQIAQTFPEVAGRAIDEGCERYNVAPTEPVLVIDAEREARLLRWGLIPAFLDDPKPKRPMINARAETVRAQPAFRELVRGAGQRCLVLTDGWYEWLKPEDPKGARVPMHMALPGRDPFAYAGLWTTWQRDGRDPISSCVIITVAASPQAATVHDRMPAVLATAAEQAAWLDFAHDGADAAALLAPHHGPLTITPANPRVNKAGVEGPENLMLP